MNSIQIPPVKPPNFSEGGGSVRKSCDSAAGCERGFFTMNDIKYTRTPLGDVLVDLLLIAIYGDSFEFD